MGLERNRERESESEIVREKELTAKKIDPVPPPPPAQQIKAYTLTHKQQCISATMGREQRKVDLGLLGRRLCNIQTRCDRDAQWPNSEPKIIWITKSDRIKLLCV